ncbi:hypothetical protein GGE65_005236 [Skermanella aerolata]|uniref:hypothetical protein n=1 Tax=Skermanella aerolata TaxID=393310 RepID=UPI003D1F964B
MLFPFPAAPRASALALSVLASSMAASGPAQAQGVTPYDTFRDAWGAPAYSSNLTTLPDDRDLLGPGSAPLLTMSDPFSERVRPARGYGEIGDPDADYFEAQADLTRQKAQSLQALDDQRRAR